VKKFLAILLAVMLVLALSISGCTAEPAEQEEEEEEEGPVLTIGALYGGPINDYGYNQALHDSIAVIAENIEGVEIIEVENVAVGAATGPMQTMINQGAKLIFATSYNMYDEALALANKNPNVKFEWCGGGKNATANLGTFFGKPPDGWYLMGMAAALMMQANNVTNPTFGFVGAFPYLGWTRTFVNAFTLGAQSVYPAVVPPAPSPVTVKVAYTYEWASLAKQVQVTNALIDQGAKVITHHVDSPQSVIQTAESRGVSSIGYQSVESYIFAPTKWICGTGMTFGGLLTPIANSVIGGIYNGTVKLWGWTQGAMQLAPWGTSVSPTVRDAVLAAKPQLEAGTRKTFAGPIYSNNGTIYTISVYPFQITAGKEIPEYALGWADTSFVWGVQVTG
jgi:basic membrane lipoprotein Med (substrate-binding protein (PBP1-ABC) superfamily)